MDREEKPSLSTLEDLRRHAIALEKAMAAIAIEQAQNLRLQEQNDVLIGLMHIDKMTKLANRTAFDNDLPELVEVAQKNSEPLAIIAVDADGLKRANDTQGHDSGDMLLGAISSALTSVARDTDLIYRTGGDEFYVVLPGFSPREDQTEEDLITDTVNRYGVAFEAAIAKTLLPPDLKVGASFGIAILNGGETTEEFIKRADVQCLANKHKRYQALKEQGIEFNDPRLLAS